MRISYYRVTYFRHTDQYSYPEQRELFSKKEAIKFREKVKGVLRKIIIEGKVISIEPVSPPGMLV